MTKATSNAYQLYNVLRLEAKMLYKPFIRHLADGDDTIESPNGSYGSNDILEVTLFSTAFSRHLRGNAG
ncbi:hypothetical protein GGI42DRAFT_26862 [Trichoderma sp. SZMC 28013]